MFSANFTKREGASEQEIDKTRETKANLVSCRESDVSKKIISNPNHINQMFIRIITMVLLNLALRLRQKGNLL